jgi:hypothetical protein
MQASLGLVILVVRCEVSDALQPGRRGVSAAEVAGHHQHPASNP